MKNYTHLLLFMAFMLSNILNAQITIDTVLVEDAGNAAQSAANRNHAESGGDGFGSVSYDYHIGTYEVTNAQYTNFLNAVAASDPHGLWNSSMGSSLHGGISRSGSDGSYTYSVRTASSGFNSGESMANMPVNYVSFTDAARFTNWLTNGQPVGAQGSGTTENGMYALNGVTTPVNNTIVRNTTAWNNGGVAIANGDEWFKAAYFNPTLNEYNLYSTKSDATPTATTPNTINANSANLSSFGAGSFTNTVSPGGAYALASSYYGTFDQTGNVQNWTEELVDPLNRGIRGGSFTTPDNFSYHSGNSLYQNPSVGSISFNSITVEQRDLGFRVTSLMAIPEPGTFVMMLVSLGTCVGFTFLRNRKVR